MRRAFASAGSRARFPLAAALVLALLAGCGGEGGEGAPATEGGDEPAGASPSTDTVAPARAAGGGEARRGGLEAWVSEIRAEMEEVELDPRASHERVRRLYTVEHARIARHYGAGGTVTGDDHPELARAVEAQGAAFRELLELTGTTHYIERTHLLHAIRNIRMALQRTLEEAREAGVPLRPPPPSGSSGP